MSALVYDQWSILSKLVDELSALSVLEATELAKMLREKWTDLPPPPSRLRLDKALPHNG
jgi:hypothetical protein